MPTVSVTLPLAKAISFRVVPATSLAPLRVVWMRRTVLTLKYGADAQSTGVDAEVRC